MLLFGDNKTVAVDSSTTPHLQNFTSIITPSPFIPYMNKLLLPRLLLSPICWRVSTSNPAGIVSKNNWGYQQVWRILQTLLVY
jgi:hypothetical protein